MDNTSNFGFLGQHDELLLQLATTAEQSFVSDPNTTMVKVRKLGEALAKRIAIRVGIGMDDRTTQVDLFNELRFNFNIDQNILDAIHEVRKIGNKAAPDFTLNSPREATKVLKLSTQSILAKALCGEPVLQAPE